MPDPGRTPYPERSGREVVLAEQDERYGNASSPGRTLARVLVVGAILAAFWYAFAPVRPDTPVPAPLSYAPIEPATGLAERGAAVTVVRAALVDVLGTEVAVVHNGPLSGELRVSDIGLAPDVYLLRVRTADTQRTVRLVRR